MDTATANRIFPPLSNRLHPTYRIGRLKGRRLDVPDARLFENTPNGRNFRRGYEHGLAEVNDLLLKLEEQAAFREFSARMKGE